MFGLSKDHCRSHSLGIQISLYDNILLLYKWSEKTDVPISLIVVQSHNQENEHLQGSKNYLFESLPQIIAHLLEEEFSASEAYYTILSFNPSITVHGEG